MMVNFFVTMTFCTMSLFLMYPVVLYFLTGVVEPILPMTLPYLNANTFKGFIGITGFHILWSAQTGLGLAAADVLIATLVVYTLPMVALFRRRFEELSDILNMGKKAQESEMVYQSLRNLVKMHQDMCRYICIYIMLVTLFKCNFSRRYLSYISRTFFYVFFAEVVGDAFSILLIIYILSTVSIDHFHFFFYDFKV